MNLYYVSKDVICEGMADIKTQYLPLCSYQILKKNNVIVLELKNCVFDFYQFTEVLIIYFHKYEKVFPTSFQMYKYRHIQED